MVLWTFREAHKSLSKVWCGKYFVRQNKCANMIKIESYDCKCEVKSVRNEILESAMIMSKNRL